MAHENLFLRFLWKWMYMIEVRSISAFFSHLYKKIVKIQTLIFHAIHLAEPLSGRFGLKLIKFPNLPLRDVRYMNRLMSGIWPVETVHIPDIDV